MKKLFTASIILCVGILGMYLWWKSISSPVNIRDTQPRDFVVSKGQSVSQIANNLEKFGFIKNPLAFRIYTQFSGRAKLIQAGDYQLSPNLSLQQIALTFEAGPQQLWVTIPEGLRREEIVEKVIKTLDLDSTQGQKFAQDFLNSSQNQEGYLFPDTYLLGKDDTADKLVSQMKDLFNQKVSPQMALDAKKNNLTLDQTIILASIIERETRTDEERPVVAGILYNRLNNNIALKIDATLQYSSANRRCYNGRNVILGCNWWQVPTADDTSLRSPFNTYLNDGLPPAPISNPGLSSIKAAIYPSQTDYFFYLHDNQGQIHYAKNGTEHQANIDKYLR